MKPKYEHVDDAIGIARTMEPGNHLFVSPTGSGKSSIGRGIKELDRWEKRAIIVTPSVEIGQGFTPEIWDHGQQEARGVYTVKTLLSKIKRGRFDPRLPVCLIQDEGHHFDNTTRELKEFLPNVKWHVGLTATGFRGTPAETAKLHGYYTNIHRVLTIRDAVDRGVISMFEPRIRPLLNDDLIDVTGGEFSSTRVDRAMTSRVDDLARIADEWWDGKRFTRTLMFTVNSLYMVDLLSKTLTLPHHCITAGTKYRKDIFADVVARTHCLIQIKAVGEGVDLPMRVLIDAAPTLSPVLWTQRVGRITRPTGFWCRNCGCPVYSSPQYASHSCQCSPGTQDLAPEEAPVYVCTNHNLMRHAYILEGCLPPAVFRDYKKHWPNWEPSGRSLRRVTGEVVGFGRLKPARVPLADGTEALGFIIDSPQGKMTQYACLASFTEDSALLARRDFVLDANGNRDYSKRAKWQTIDKLPDLTGYASCPASPLTPGQKNWWEKAAARYGLDATARPDSKAFQFLPVLSDLNLRVSV